MVGRAKKDALTRLRHPTFFHELPAGAHARRAGHAQEAYGLNLDHRVALYQSAQCIVCGSPLRDGFMMQRCAFTEIRRRVAEGLRPPRR